MAVEARRGCGYRKVGGLYLVGGGIKAACVKMPYQLVPCPVCNSGLKFQRGFSWVKASHFFDVNDCPKLEPSLTSRAICTSGGVPGKCPFKEERVGILWVGQNFYTPEEFIVEAVRLGVSKRITTIPRELKLNETYILLAHKQGKLILWTEESKCGDCDKFKHGCPVRKLRKAEAKKSKMPFIPITEDKTAYLDCFERHESAIFYAFVPQRVEMIITETQSKDEEFVKGLADRGITPVVVPDNDKDHQGTVYDKDDDGEAPEEKKEGKDEGGEGVPTGVASHPDADGAEDKGFSELPPPPSSNNGEKKADDCTYFDPTTKKCILADKPDTCYLTVGRDCRAFKAVNI